MGEPTSQQPKPSSDAGHERPGRIGSSPGDTSLGYPALREQRTQLHRSPEVPSSLGSGHRDAVDGHDRFGTGEIAIACSYYELGIIRRVLEFRRGSRRSPKVVLETSRGKLLLKRRAVGRDTSQGVAFAHSVQSHLNRHSFPLARLVPTRDGRTFITNEGMVFELFEFIDGTRYDRSTRATFDAGRTMATMHRTVAAHRPTGQPSAGGFHDSPIIPAALSEIPSVAARPELAEVCQQLAGWYEQAAGQARRLGIGAWPRQTIHGDFHPGNLVFSASTEQGAEEASRVRAVLDYDACRVGPRAIDIANGSLQFSVTRQGLDPAEWPVELDLTRLRAFLAGYDGVPDCILSKAELIALPWLMVEALIAEAAMPIRATGRFGQVDGGVFLEMVARKANWIMEQHEEISRL